MACPYGGGAGAVARVYGASFRNAADPPKRRFSPASTHTLFQVTAYAISTSCRDYDTIGKSP